MGLLTRRSALLAFLLAALPLSAQTPLSRISVTPDSTVTTQLSGHVPAWATTARDAGPIAPGTRLQHISILLARDPATEAAFQQLLADQQNPNSPRFHQWLTPAQTGALYGVAQHDIDAVTAWLTAQGLTVDDIPASRVFISFSGDAASVARALSTDFHNFTSPDPKHPGLQYAPTHEPSIPSALTPVIAGFVGLSQEFHHPALQHQRATRDSLPGIDAGAHALTQTGTVSPDVNLGSGSSLLHWILPADFATVYDLGPAYNAGSTGAGQRIAIVGGSRVYPADITNYEAISGLPSSLPSSIVVPGESDPGLTGTGLGGTGDQYQSEATLDVTRVLGTATGSPIDLLLISSLTDTDILNAINYNISTLNDPVFSISFGRCEIASASNRSAATSFDTAFATGAAQGISFFASSGDTEVAECATSTSYTAGLTASTNIICTPNVTCVGGTQFSDTANPSLYWSSTNNSVNNGSALSYIPEGAWNEPAAVNSAGTTTYELLGTGGAPSIFWPKPAWQTGTGVPADSARDTPDISLSASGHNSYVLCLAFDNADCSKFVEGVFGTSAAAPSMAAIAAMLDQNLNARQGNLNPLLYRLATSAPNAFHDATPATSGISSCAVTTASTCNNSTPGATGLSGGLAGYPLTTGYDLATGLGSVDVYNLFTAAAGVISLAPTTSTLTASSTAVTTSQTVNFTDTISSSTAGTETGTVQFAIAGANSGTPVTIVSGAASDSISFPSTGTYTVTATYSGDTHYAVSTGTVTITVTAPVIPITVNTLTGTTGTITTQQTAAYTATITSAATGTPAGTVQFFRTQSGSIVTTSLGTITLVSGVATLPSVALPAGTYGIEAVYSGNSAFAASTSKDLALTVIAVPTTTTLTPAVSTITSTGSVTYTATVVNSSSTGTPTGTIQFTIDGVLHGAGVPLSGLSVTSPALNFTAGAHTVNAIYSGDSVFATSTSGTANVTSTAAPTTIAFNPAPPATAFTATTVPLTAVVSGLGSLTTTSTIVFKDSVAILATVTPVFSATTGTATFTAGPFLAGTHPLTATFTGDSNYTTSTTAVASLVVTAPSTFTITPSPAAITVASGASTGNTSTLTFTSVNAFAGLITPVCAVKYSGSGTPVNAPTCIFAPLTVTLAAGSSLTDTLSIGTTVPHLKNGSGNISFTHPPATPGNAAGRIAAGITLSSLLMLLLPSTRRRALRNWRGLSLLCLLSGALYAASGCGSGGSNSTPTPTPTPTPLVGTTPGQYVITITGTSGATGLSTVSASTTIALTVQ